MRRGGIIFDRLTIPRDLLQSNLCSSHLNVRDKAIARSLRVLLEDHLYWALVIEHQQLGRSSSSLASGPASGPSNLMSSFFNNATPRQVNFSYLLVRSNIIAFLS